MLTVQKSKACARFWVAAVALIGCSATLGADLRLGIVGCDTSHVVAFTEALNNSEAKDHLPGAKVVAAYKGGSKDVQDSWSRVEGFSATLRDKHGIKFYDSIEELVQNVDAVLLESMDARTHLPQFKQILQGQGWTLSGQGLAPVHNQRCQRHSPPGTHLLRQFVSLAAASVFSRVVHIMAPFQILPCPPRCRDILPD